MKRWLALGLLALGCGSSERGESASDSGVFQPPECASESSPPCEDDSMFACPASTGYDSIIAINSHDSETDATISVPGPGTLCYAGTLHDNADYDTYAELILALDDRGDMGKCVYSVFDAVALGVSAIEFTLEKAPPVPFYLTARSIISAECEDPSLCTGELNVWLTPDRQELVDLTSGTHTAKLADLIGSDSLMPLDRRRIALFSLRMSGIFRPVDFDFCVSDIRFLGDAGLEVDVPKR